MSQDFKHKLTKFHDTFPPEEWEAKREKRLTKDEQNILTAY